MNIDAKIWSLHHKLSESIAYAAPGCGLNKEGMLLEGFAAENAIFCSENFQVHILRKREATRLNRLPFTSLKLVGETLWSIKEILKDVKILATSDLMRRSQQITGKQAP